MEHEKKLIVVLGPHRSGTSLCASAIKSLGADLAIAEQYANEENQKGFFEQPEIVSFNDKLLAYLGGVWDNPLFDGPEALAKFAKDEHAWWQNDAVKIFSAIFSDKQLVAVKDPRFCQLLNFWLPVFESCGFALDNTYFVHTHRDPVEVALSQHKRVKKTPAFYEIGRDIAEAAALWLSLSAQAMEQSKAFKNYFVSYQSVLDNPEQELDGLADFLSLPHNTDQTRAFCENFVDRSLAHNSANAEAVSALEAALPQIFEFSQAQKKLLNKKDLTEKDFLPALGIYNRADTREALVKITGPTLSRLSNACREDRLLNEKHKDEINKLSAQLHELKTGNDAFRLEHEAVVTPLREAVTELQKGNAFLNEKVAGLESNNARLVHENTHLFDDHIKATAALRAELSQLKVSARKLEESFVESQETIRRIHNTLSWRITKPLRFVRRLQRDSRVTLAKSWLSVKTLSLRGYDKIAPRHPKFARLLRVTLSPVSRLITRWLIGRLHASSSHYAMQKNSAQKSAAPMMHLKYQAIEATPDYRPLVSVIVPNYNHEKYLRQRLESIFSQSYQNFEVILLDDCSQDESVNILKHYQDTYADKCRLVVNKENSGGVFYQWEKGLTLARGDIVWIAESDDWCSPNFLETLVPFFENEATQLAYAKTLFMDGAGEKQIWSINEYLHDIDFERWHEPHVETAHKIVNSAFAIKNIIPNVSSALFRYPGELELLKDAEWKKMRTCGDWVLYLHLIRGGLLAYSPDAQNFYRIHDSNTSVASYAEDRFYCEHEIVAKTVQKYYRVEPSVFETQYDNLVMHWKRSRPSYSDEAFDACYSLSRIMESARKQEINLLMAGYGFCAGGGETFPVQLANLMKAHGYNLTYLDCAQEPRNPLIRDSLRKDIPVVSNFPELERIVNDFGIDIVHSHHAWVDNMVLDLLPEDSACRTLVTLHGMYETIADEDLARILPRLVDRSAALVYTAEKNTTALRHHDLIEQSNLVRIDNALDIYPVEKIERSRLGIAEDAFVLTLVSRAIPDKGWKEAVEAVNLARTQSNKDIHLILIGEGPEYDSLRRGPIPSFVHLEGFKKNIRGYFAISELGFLPSRFHGESFPLVVIDCLHAGRPVLASSVGEIPYMLNTESGLAGMLFDLDNWVIPISEVAGIINLLATDKDRYQELLGRVPDAAIKFDPELLCRNYDRVYRNAVQENEIREIEITNECIVSQ